MVNIFYLRTAANEAIQSVFAKAVEAFKTANETASATNLNAFTASVNELIYTIESEGFSHILVTGDEYTKFITAARERTQRAIRLITDAQEAIEESPKEPAPQKRNNFVRTNPKGIRYISLQRWAKQFYSEDSEFESPDFDDLASEEIVLLLRNMKLAYRLFHDDEKAECMEVLRATAQNIARAEVDCIIMPRDASYDPYREDDKLILFTRGFVANQPPFGFTVCDCAPIRRKQPRLLKENSSFRFPHRRTANIAVASTISSPSFADGHHNRFEEIEDLVNSFLREYIKDDHISERTLAEFLNRSRKYAQEDRLDEEFSFTSIKLSTEYAPLIERLNKDIENSLKDFPITFSYQIPQPVIQE